MRPLAIACRLNPFEFAVRRKTLLPAVVARAEHSEPLPDGMRWRFRPSSDLLLALAAMIDAERRCCPFLRFQLLAEPDNRPVSLEVTGPEGTREFLDALPHR
jgi:hypothetical protein